MIAVAGLAAWLGALAAAASAAGPQTDHDVILLARVKTVMSENLKRQPNYTCTETIERLVRRAGARRFQLLDKMRLEVALVEGKELFAWPGAGHFEEREILDFAPSGGAIGNGNFALHARAVFQGRAPVMRFAGEETRDGRSLLRFDYSVAQMGSGFELRSGTATARVGYRGSFWADPTTMDVTRLEVIAVDIPPDLGLSEARDFMDYARLRIGESDFLLPVASEMTLTDARGNENRNRISFSGCRQYAGQSVISFEEPAPAGTEGEAAVPARAIELPEGLELAVELSSAIESEQSAVGDRVTAVVVRDAKWKGRTVAPKGAVVSGRLAYLGRREGGAGRTQANYFLVGIEFDTLEFESARAAFRGRLDEVGPLAVPNIRSAGSQPMVLDAPRLGEEARPGVGYFLLKGDTIRIGRGFRMMWSVAAEVRR